MPHNEGGPPVALPDHPQPTSSERLTVPVTLVGAPAPAKQITPHRIITVAFIVEYLNVKQDEKIELAPSDRTNISAHLLNLIMFSDQSLGATLHNLRQALPEGCQPIIAKWARNLLDLKKKGIAGLMDLFLSVEKLIIDESQNFVTRRSLVGRLLRRLFLQFDKLSFSEVSSVEVQLSEYVSAGTTALKSILQEDKESTNETDASCMEISSDNESTTMFDSSLPNSLFGHSLDDSSCFSEDFSAAMNTGSMSRKQADLFIARQSNLIQKAEGQALSPIMLKKEIDGILKSNPEISEAYFLSYLNNLRVGEVSLAVDDLHKASYHVISASSNQTDEEISQSFRYAVLNLGSLHARFGHESETKAAIREAVTIGQKERDHACLQHCLSWIIRETKDGDNIALNQRSISRCEELNLPYLASLGILNLASRTEQLAHKPEYLLDLLTRSSLLNCKYNLVELQGDSFLTRGQVWATWGRSFINQTLQQILLSINFNRDGIPFQGESAVIALCNMALNLENEGFRDLVDSILAICQSHHQNSTSLLSKVWKITRQKILFSRFLCGGDWAKADITLGTLSALQSELEICLLRAELSFRLGDMDATRHLVAKIINESEQKKSALKDMNQILVKALILMSEVQVVSQQTGGALQYLLKAKAVCEKHRLELLHCIVCLHIANNHLVLGLSKKALLLVRRCLVFLLAHGSLRDRSRGLLLSAKCRIASSADLGNVERRSDLLEGATQVGHARDGFLRLQDWDRVKDCLYLQARIYHSLGLTLERNMAAREYKKYDELYPSTAPILQLVLL